MSKKSFGNWTRQSANKKSKKIRKSQEAGPDRTGETRPAALRQPGHPFWSSSRNYFRRAPARNVSWDTRKRFLGAPANVSCGHPLKGTRFRAPLIYPEILRAAQRAAQRAAASSPGVWSGDPKKIVLDFLDFFRSAYRKAALLLIPKI